MCSECDRKAMAIKKAGLRKKLKPTHGVKKEGGAYDVVANSGRPEGRFKTRKAAAQRVRQIEYFKHHPGS